MAGSEVVVGAAPVTPQDPTGEPDDAQPAVERETIPSLERYAVLKKLAVGGMAEIFIAQKEGAEEICVVKLLHEHLTRDPVVSSRFLREAQVAALLDHPNIARLTDAKREKGLLFLAMEFIAGQDVESMMFKLMDQRKMLPPELSVTVTLDVLAGLHYAHEFRGPDGNHLAIVHRDLSPRNVMVTYAGQVKIIDFGLARTNLGDFRTAPGMVMGTLRYMSPEQAVADPVDQRSDIYSWGVVLYEMLSGRPLVNGHGTAQEILHAVVTQVPPPLSSFNASLPKALDAVLERALEKDRRDRFSTAGEFRQALLEAAGPLAALDDERHRLIGDFVSELFPEEHAKTLSLLQESQRLMPVDHGPYSPEATRYGAPGESTRVGVPGEVTRHGVPEVTRYGAPDVTRYGMPDVTRYGMPGDPMRAHAAGTQLRPVVRAHSAANLPAIDPSLVAPVPDPAGTGAFATLPITEHSYRSKVPPPPAKKKTTMVLAGGLAALGLVAVAGVAVVTREGPTTIASIPDEPKVTAQPTARVEPAAAQRAHQQVAGVEPVDRAAVDRAAADRAAVDRATAERVAAERAAAQATNPHEISKRAVQKTMKSVTGPRPEEGTAARETPASTSTPAAKERRYPSLWKKLEEAERVVKDWQGSGAPTVVGELHDDMMREAKAISTAVGCVDGAAFLPSGEQVAKLRTCLNQMEKAKDPK